MPRTGSRRRRDGKGLRRRTCFREPEPCPGKVWTHLDALAEGLRKASRRNRCISPFASQETANARIAMASGQKMGASALDATKAQDTATIIVSPQTRHTSSRHRLSVGRSRLFGMLDSWIGHSSFAYLVGAAEVSVTNSPGWSCGGEGSLVRGQDRRAVVPGGRL